MATFILTVIGDDRPGLVSALSAAINAHGASWERSQMSRLAGKFAGIVLVTVADKRLDSMMADLACATLVRRTIAAERVRHLHHQIQYFRPTPMIGHTEYRARLVEQSRKFATLECLILDGRGATTARASQLISVTQDR